MSHKYIAAAKSNTCSMIKVDINGKQVWVEVAANVKAFASKNFKEGDQIEFEHTESNGKYRATGMVKKVGGSTGNSNGGYQPKPSQGSSTPSQQPISTPNSYQGGNSYKSPEVQASIRSQAIGHMTSRTLIALQGHVDPNNVHDLIKEIYNTYNGIV